MSADDMLDMLDEEACVLGNSPVNCAELPEIEHDFDEMCDDISFNRYEE